MRARKLRLGLFLPPYHPVGEHHSGGYENSPSPELMIAAASQRTKSIRLGTGVVSLPYHNPLMTANRIAQLDHLTRGRLRAFDKHQSGKTP